MYSVEGWKSLEHATEHMARNDVAFSLYHLERADNELLNTASRISASDTSLGAVQEVALDKMACNDI